MTTDPNTLAVTTAIDRVLRASAASTRVKALATLLYMLPTTTDPAVIPPLFQLLGFTLDEMVQAVALSQVVHAAIGSAG